MIIYILMMTMMTMTATIIATCEACRLNLKSIHW